MYSDWLAARPDTTTTSDPPAAPVAASEGPKFMASESFTGPRAGYYFGTGLDGTGFYQDTGGHASRICEDVLDPIWFDS